jgi:hypothetical protein
MSKTVVCPKCKSDQLTSNKKGFSGGKAIAGALLTGGVGIAAGFLGSNDVVITCMACGNTFNAGKGKIIEKSDIDLHKQTGSSGYSPSENYDKPFDGTVNGNNAVICSECKCVNGIFVIKCMHCQKAITISDERIYDERFDKKVNSSKGGCLGVIMFVIATSVLAYFIN